MEVSMNMRKYNEYVVEQLHELFTYLVYNNVTFDVARDMLHNITKRAPPEIATVINDAYIIGKLLMVKQINEEKIGGA
jgi:hypothetical protein